MDKRQRGKNYTESEKCNLIEIVQDYAFIVENKKTDDMSAKLKKETWDVIANKYNAINQTGSRTGCQIKLLYENIKQKAKKDKANEKVEIYKTGGGMFWNKMDPISSKFLDTSGAQIPEIQNAYDSTAMLDAAILNANQDQDIASSTFIYTEASIISEELADEETNTAAASSPKSLPAHKKKKTFGNKKKQISQGKVDDIKQEILKVRLEKEKTELDILLLKKEEMKLNNKRKKNELQILIRNEGLTVTDSD